MGSNASTMPALSAGTACVAEVGPPARSVQRPPECRVPKRMIAITPKPWLSQSICHGVGDVAESDCPRGTADGFVEASRA